MSWIGAVAASRGARANRAMTAVRRKEMRERREGQYTWTKSPIGVSERFSNSTEKDRIRQVEATRDELNMIKRQHYIMTFGIVLGVIAVITYPFLYFFF